MVLLTIVRIESTIWSLCITTLYQVVLKFLVFKPLLYLFRIYLPGNLKKVTLICPSILSITITTETVIWLTKLSLGQVSILTVVFYGQFTSLYEDFILVVCSFLGNINPLKIFMYILLNPPEISTRYSYIFQVFSRYVYL